jgi:hypothetical protein
LLNAVERLAQRLKEAREASARFVVKRQNE